MTFSPITCSPIFSQSLPHLLTQKILFFHSDIAAQQLLFHLYLIEVAKGGRSQWSSAINNPLVWTEHSSFLAPQAIVVFQFCMGTGSGKKQQLPRAKRSKPGITPLFIYKDKNSKILFKLGREILQAWGSQRLIHMVSNHDPAMGYDPRPGQARKLGENRNSMEMNGKLTTSLLILICSLIHIIALRSGRLNSKPKGMICLGMWYRSSIMSAVLCKAVGAILTITHHSPHYLNGMGRVVNVCALA